jgi:hypothetical protein
MGGTRYFNFCTHTTKLGFQSFDKEKSNRGENEFRREIKKE